jgi:hypothetical protein
VKSSSSRLSNSVAAAKNIWLLIAFDRETAALIRRSSGNEDDAHTDSAISYRVATTMTQRIFNALFGNARHLR